MNSPEQTNQNRRIRIFVSSTFRDMVAERVELMTHAWPELRRFCRERQVELVEVDLRWGIAEEQSTRKETLKLCLDEIRACHPFFIGLLGERYGWVPGDDAFTSDLLEEQPWLAILRDRSVTELEIVHGVLREEQMHKRAFFYFRDPSYLDHLAPGTNRADFERESQVAKSKLNHLKQAIRHARDEGVCKLHENYPDPIKLAALVFEDLKAAIEAQFPIENIPDALTREARDHEAFAETRRRTYINRPDYFEALDRHATGDDTPIIILGESGIGKSALLANWLAHWHTVHPRDFIFQHYIGGTPDSTEHWRLITRLIAEIKRWTDDPEELPKSHDDLLKTLPVWLAKARIKAERDGVRCILVLDALNQLEDRDHARLLGWLPSHPFTDALRLVVSTLPGDTLDAVAQRSWKSLRVELLTLEERRLMIEHYLARFGKKLDAPRLEQIATAPAAANPFFLKTLLDELRVTGTHVRLDERLQNYLAATDIPALLKKVLARYQRDYERDRPGLVSEALGLIWAARRGLTETELQRLLRPRSQSVIRNPQSAIQDLPQLPLARWTPLRSALEEGLVDRGGILNFAHDFLRDAVRDSFLPIELDQRRAHTRLADYFDRQPTGRRRTDELPWQLCESRSYTDLVRLLSDRRFFSEFFDGDHCDPDLRRYWTKIESDSEYRVEKEYLNIVEEADFSQGMFAVNVAQLLGQMGRLTGALHLIQRVGAYLQANGDPRFVRLLGFQANIMADRGDLTAAMRLYQEQEKYLIVLDDRYALQYCIGNQGIILRDQGDSKGALDHYRRQEKICRDLNYGAGLQLCLGNKALVLWDLGDIDAAVRLLQDQLQMCRELGDLEGLSTSLGNMGEMMVARGDHDEALKLFKQQETTCRNLGYRYGLQASLLNQAVVIESRGDQEMALKVLEEQAALSRDLGDANHHAMSLMHQALVLSRQGHTVKALEKADLGQGIAIQHGLTRTLERYAPLIASIRGEHAAVAAVILDLPSNYQRQIRKRFWCSLAMSRASNNQESCFLAEKVKMIPPDWLVVLVTTEELRLREYLAKRAGGGRNERSFYFCTPSVSRVRTAYSPDELKDEAGAPTLVQEGSLSCFRALAESDVLERLLDRGVRYLHISFIEALSSAIDLARLGLLMREKRTLLAEVVPIMGTEGPFLIRVEERPMLVEREQISEATFQRIVENPQNFPVAGNNTFWVNVPLLLKELGITRSDITRRRRSGGPVLGLEELAPAINSTVLDGASFKFVDQRLSSLTHLFETMFLAVSCGARSS